MLFFRFNQSFVNFYAMLSIKSALNIANPQSVMIHSNTRVTGEFWDLIKDDER